MAVKTIWFAETETALNEERAKGATYEKIAAILSEQFGVCLTTQAIGSHFRKMRRASGAPPAKIGRPRIRPEVGKRKRPVPATVLPAAVTRGGRRRPGVAKIGVTAVMDAVSSEEAPKTWSYPATASVSFPDVPQEAPGLTIFDLGWNQCRWPISEHRGEPLSFRFCGAPAARDGGSWCHMHMRVGHQHRRHG